MPPSLRNLLPALAALVLCASHVAAQPGADANTTATLRTAAAPAPTPVPPAIPEGLAPWDLEKPAAAKTSPFDLGTKELPDYGDLRLRTGVQTKLGERYLQTLPLLRGDVVTTTTIFADVPKDAEYSLLSLGDLVDITLKHNLSLRNQRRSVLIARSSTTSAEAQFKPFVDLVGNARIAETRDAEARPLAPSFGQTETTTRESRTATLSGGVEVRQNLPTGGSITLDATETRTDTDNFDSTARFEDRSYSTRAEVRFLQPLLRGGGIEVGTAQLRSTRLQEMDQNLDMQISERDTILRVIGSYFRIASTKQQLQVSADAIKERKRFLEETQLRYEVGRVAESEILRAEIQYLQELETAINRREQLDSAREELLLLLGLPLETPISLVDMTPQLIDRGRVDIPRVEDAIKAALEGRPELMKSDISLALSKIDNRVAKNDLLPDLNFDAGYNRNDRDRDLGEANEFKDSGWDAGLSMRVPLINIQRREAYRRSNLRLEQAETQRLITERQITQEVINAHRQVLSTEASLTLLLKTVEQARKNLELTNGSFEVGFSSVTDVRLAQDDLFQAETRYRSALLSYQNNIAQLYTAMGLPLY